MSYQGGIGSRREARERALSLLYEAESKGVSAGDIVAALPVLPEPFAVELVVGVDDHVGDIDELIGRLAEDWSVDRMPAIDRAILRLATYELAHRPEIPTAAIVSEAVELATQYSTDDSSKFVNGLLAAIATEIRPT